MEQNTRLLPRHNNRQSTILTWAFVLIMLLSIPPFYLWNISNAISIVSIVVFFFYGLWKRPHDPFRRISLFLFSIFYLYASMSLYEDFNLIGVLWNGFRILLPVMLLFISEENWAIIYKRFLTIYATILIPSLFVYFCAMWIGIDLPHKLIPPLNEIKDYNYYAYPFMVITDKIDSFRFCGYFDEPGVIGNISGVLLIVNRCNMRDWRSWVLLISGIFSFSLFFYGLVALYIFLFGSKMAKIVLLLVIAMAVAFLVTSDNVFNQLIIARLEMDNNGEMAGASRTIASFDVFWKKFLDSNMLWFGYGHRYSALVVDPGGQSFKHLIVDYGIIMFIIYICAFLFYYMSYHVKKKHLMFLMMIMFSVLYQRPFILSCLYLSLMIFPAAVVKYSFESRSNKNK